jgi:polyisoprenoid-binding protein YceI
VDLASIDTGNADDDAHVRSADFLDVDRYRRLTYRSTDIRADGADFVVDGELSLHGVTKSVPLHLEVNGFQPDSPFGDTRAGFTGTAEIDRRDFGVEFVIPLERAGSAWATRSKLEIETIRQDADG